MPNDADKEIKALEARIKELRREKLSDAERRSIRWLQKEVGDRAVSDFLRSCPKNIYAELSGRARKTLDEQADSHNLPLRRPNIDLYEAVQALHDRVIEYAKQAKLAETSETGDLRDEKLRQEIRLKEHQVAMLQIELKNKNREFVPRDSVRDALQYVTTKLTELGQTLRRKFGDTAQTELNKFCDEMAKEIESGSLNL